MKGFHGKILVVDLNQQTFKIEELPEEIYRKYLGGYGLGAYYLYKHMPPNCDPLGPHNILGFTPGLFTGSGAPFSGRYMVCGKSPLTGKGNRTNGEVSTGGWGNANSGGTFGPAIKHAGFDAIFFTGQSLTPVYLLITNDSISLEDAALLWGKDTVTTEEELEKIHDRKANVASIGVAGENLSLISGIVNDRGRIAARSGLGAVMGSKKLKAICLVANKKVEFDNRSKMQELTKKNFSRMKTYKENRVVAKIGSKIDYFAPFMRVTRMGLTAPSKILPQIMGGFYGGVASGTLMSTIISSQNGDSPVKNYKGVGYRDYPMKKALKLRFKDLNVYAKKQYGCFSCPLKCGYMLEYDNLPHQEKETHRPEYETVCAFGALILNEDLDLLLQANEYLNRVGLDSISTGLVVAYVLEAVEEGFMKKEDFICKAFPEGFLPIWGDPTYIMPLLKLIVTREGIGDKLADGVAEAKLHFPGTDHFAITANGSAMGMHDMRLTSNYTLPFISDPTPGRHTAGNLDYGKMGMTDFYPDLKPMVEKTDTPYQQGKAAGFAIKMHQVMESLGLCMFVYFFSNYSLLEMIEYTTGWKMDVDEVLEIGGRIQTTRQMFNAREGAIRHEVPKRAIGDPPMKNGPLRGNSIDAEMMMQGYYAGMGFEQDGVPRAETLASYGLKEMISDLAISTGAPKRLINNYLDSKTAIQKSE